MWAHAATLDSSAHTLTQKDEFDARHAMGKLFPVIVKLEAPRSGSHSSRHWEQLQKDSQDMLADSNRRHLASLLSSE